MLTQKQLAEKIGVSQQSVSFALSGRGTIKQETRDYIIKEARKAGYRVNLASRGVREGRTNIIGLIVHGNFHSLPNIMLSELRPILRRDRKHLSLFAAELGDFEDPNRPPEYFTEMLADGFLIMHDDVNDGQLSMQLTQYRIPAVRVNQKQSHNSVYPDEYSIIKRAVRELSSRHKGFIAFYGPADRPGQHYSAGERIRGFSDALEEYKLAGEVFENPYFVLEKQREIHAQVRAILSRDRKRPKVVIAATKENAQVFFTQANLLGLRVPRDLVIAVITRQYGDAAWLNFYRIMVPLWDCGKIAYKELLKRIEYPSYSFPSIAVDEFIMHDPDDFSVIYGD